MPNDVINLHANNLDALLVHATAAALEHCPKTWSNISVKKAAIIAAVRTYKDKLDKHDDREFRLSGLIVAKHWAQANVT
jgi:hypothetical protein